MNLSNVILLKILNNFKQCLIIMHVNVQGYIWSIQRDRVDELDDFAELHSLHCTRTIYFLLYVYNMNSFMSFVIKLRLLQVIVLKHCLICVTFFICVTM